MQNEQQWLKSLGSEIQGIQGSQKCEGLQRCQGQVVA